jgi:hypothetical protein
MPDSWCDIALNATISEDVQWFAFYGVRICRSRAASPKSIVENFVVKLHLSNRFYSAAVAD